MTIVSLRPHRTAVRAAILVVALGGLALGAISQTRAEVVIRTITTRHIVAVMSQMQAHPVAAQPHSRPAIQVTMQPLDLSLSTAASFGDWDEPEKR